MTSERDVRCVDCGEWVGYAPVDHCPACDLIAIHGSVDGVLAWLDDLQNVNEGDPR